MKRIFIIAALLFGLTNLMQAEPDQKNTNFFLTGNIYLNGNIYSSDFRDLPGFANAAPIFESAFAIAPAFGIGGEYRFDEEFLGLNFRYSFKLMYADLSANYSVDEHIGNNIVGNSYEKIISNYRLEPSIKVISTEHLMAIYPKFEIPISFLAGFQIAFPMSPEVYQIEKLKSPANINYAENGTRERNELSGEMIDASSALFSLSLGARYEAYKSDNFAIVPELIFSLGLNDVVVSRNWKANSIRAGVAMHYNIPKSIPEPIVPAAKPPMPKPMMPIVEALDFVQKIKYRDVILKDGATIPIPLTLDQVIDYNHHQPLMFFKKGSADFNNSFVANSSIGRNIEIFEGTMKAIKEYRDTMICTIGTSADEDEKVFEKRKAKVIEFLKSNEFGDYGEISFLHNPSNDSKLKPQLQEESRYVLFQKAGGENMAVKSLHIISEKYHSNNKNVVHFISDIPSNIDLKSFSLEAKCDGNIVYQTTDTNGRLNIIDKYYLKTNHAETSQLEIKAAIETKDGRKIERTNTYLISPIATNLNRITNIEDGPEMMTVGYFDFDDDKFSVIDNNIIEKVIFAAREGRRVTIIPYTDNMGSKEYNTVLAAKRAEAAIKVLMLREGEYKIKYPEEYLFENNSPVGRVLNRCVIIVLE